MRLVRTRYVLPVKSNRDVVARRLVFEQVRRTLVLPQADHWVHANRLQKILLLVDLSSGVVFVLEDELALFVPYHAVLTIKIDSSVTRLRLVAA